jgi:hypothetical protein
VIIIYTLLPSVNHFRDLLFAFFGYIFFCMSDNKPKRGRPVKKAALVQSVSFLLKIRKGERASWKKAAKAAGMTLTAWIREQCNNGLLK